MGVQRALRQFHEHSLPHKTGDWTAETKSARGYCNSLAPSEEVVNFGGRLGWRLDCRDKECARVLQLFGAVRGGRELSGGVDYVSELESNNVASGSDPTRRNKTKVSEQDCFKV